MCICDFEAKALLGNCKAFQTNCHCCQAEACAAALYQYCNGLLHLLYSTDKPFVYDPRTNCRLCKKSKISLTCSVVVFADVSSKR